MASTIASQQAVTAKVRNHKATAQPTTAQPAKVKVDWTACKDAIKAHIQALPPKTAETFLRTYEDLVNLTVIHNPYGGNNAIPSMVTQVLGEIFYTRHPEEAESRKATSNKALASEVNDLKAQLAENNRLLALALKK
jgi:hypothetical protein